MMTYLLQVSTCWILFYGIYILFLQKETFFNINRFYLLGSLILGLFIPHLGGFLPENQTSTEVIYAMNQVSAVEIISHPETVTFPFTLIDVLYVVYLLGALLVLSRFLYGLSKIYFIFKGSSKTTYANYTLIESDKIHLPFSFFHFVFISKKLPLRKDIEKIIQHEELHASQWHSIDIIILELLQIFFWFNPILIFYKAALRQSHEYLADSYVTKNHSRNSYGQLLLRQSTSGLEIALANHFFHSQIKKRITMMYKEKSRRSAMVKYLTAIPVLIGLLVLFASNRSTEENSNELITEISTDLNLNKNTYPFNGRKIIQRSIPKNITGTGTITVNASANNKGDITYAQIDVSETTIEDRVDQKKVLKAVKSYKIEAGTSTTEGKLIFNFGDSDTKLSLSTASQDLFGLKDQLSQLQNAQSDPIFKVVEEMPRFPGCEESSGTAKEKEKCAKSKMLTFIYENLKYPKKAIEENIEGMTVVQFVVEKNGEISLGEVLRKIGGGCDEEALRVVNSMPKWIPGKQKGETVRVKYTLPIKYKLEGPITPNPITKPTAKVIALGERSTEVKKEEFNLTQKVLNDIYSQNKEVYSEVDNMPLFSGCNAKGLSSDQQKQCSDQKMLEYIYTHIKYPAEARKKGIDGKAVVSMIIEKDGSVSSTKIIRDPGAGTGAEAKRVIDNMPKWTPGVHLGKNVKVQLVIPIQYKLEGEKEIPVKAKENNKLENSNVVEVETVVKVDQLPLFPNTSDEKESISELLNFVFSKVKYPKKAKMNKIEGMAVVKFVVNAEGGIQNVRLVKSPGWGIDEVVLDLMEKMKDIDTPWTPAVKDKQTVNYEYTFPVKFKLQDEELAKVQSRNLEIQEISIRPNPSNGIFSLSFQLSEEHPVDILFYSVNGQTIKKITKVDPNFARTIDLSEFRGQNIFMNIIQNDKVFSDQISIK